MRHSRLQLFALAALLTVSGLVRVQAQTLDECRRMAREHYPEIRQYELISQTEQFNLSNAARTWIPQVVVSAQATYQSATPTYPDVLANMLAAQGIEMAGLRKDQYKVALDVSQHIWDGGQSKAARAATQAEAIEQRRAVDVDIYALEERVEDIYFGILLLDERIAQTEAKIGLLQSSFDKVCTYCRNGVAMQADADAVEAELLTARQALQQAQVSQSNFRRMLEIFIGQPLADERLPRPAMCDLQSRESARPELELFDARLDLLSAREKSVVSSVMPRFSAFAQGFYGYPGLDMFKGMMSSDWTLNGIVGVRMSWNIGAFWTKKNSLQTLRTAREQVEVQRDIFLFNTQLRTTQEEGEIARLRDAVADDERIAELRRSVRMAAESQLANGVIDTTDLLRKITDETTAVLNKNTHEIELLQAAYKIKHTLNQ
ncbi:MAG: TolC family protein [Muribaculaceae bacterium]|nr:TolC family protein [Muribaculaceae bacterium]